MRTGACLLLVLLWLSGRALAQPALSVGPDMEATTLEGYLARLDATRPVPPARLLTALFRPVDEHVVNYGDDAQHHYLRFRLTNPGSRPSKLVLRLEQQFFDLAELLTYDAAGRLRQQQPSHWALPLGQRPVPYRLHAFSINIRPGESQTLVLHTKVNAHQRISKALLMLHNEADFQRTDLLELLLTGLVLGGMLLALAVGGILYWRTQQGVYGLYCLYVVAIVEYLLNVNGLWGILSVSPNNVLSYPSVGTAALTVASALQGWFYLYFLDIRGLGYEWLHRWANALFGLLMVEALVWLIWPDAPSARYVGLMVGAAYLLTIATFIGVGLRQQRPDTYWLGLGLLPPTALLLYFLLTNWGLPVNFWLFSPLITSPVAGAEVLMLGIGLVERFNADRKRAILQLNEVERSITRRVMQAQEEERQQLAADLHDDLGGTLATLQNDLAQQAERWPQAVATALQLTERSVEDLRLISHHLMPQAFARKGLRQVLEEAVYMANRSYQTTRVFLATYGTERRLPLEHEINTYRILREWLTNALKHARASQICVQLIYYDTFLYASVEDNGRGLRPSPGQQGGIGLKNSQLRAEYLHARLTTESSAHGTLLAIEVPYPSTPE